MEYSDKEEEDDSDIHMDLEDESDGDMNEEVGEDEDEEDDDEEEDVDDDEVLASKTKPNKSKDDLDEAELSAAEEEGEEEEEEEEEDEAEEEEEEEVRQGGGGEGVQLPQANTAPVSKFVYEACSESFRDFIRMLPGGEMKHPTSLAQSSQSSHVEEQFQRVLGQLAASRGFAPLMGGALLPPDEMKLLNDTMAGHEHLTAYVNQEHRLLLVHYLPKGKICIEAARQLEGVCKALMPLQLVLISEQGITSAGQKLLVQFVKNTCVFLTHELQRNYTQHSLVPDQVPLTDTEARALLKKYSITRKQMPRMSRKDSICKFFGWPSGTIVKSTRILGGTMEPYIYYRCVF